jgi:hypothetical protein
VQEKSTFFRKDAQRYSFFLIYANFWRQKSQKKKKADAKKGNAEHTEERGRSKKGTNRHRKKKNKHREKNGTGRGPEIRKRHIMREKIRRGATMAQFLIPIYR